MSKYLNKSEDQLQQQLAEIQQALEQKEKLQQDALGAIFSRFLKEVDEPKAAKYFLNIIEKNGDKAEKKSLKILMNKLKKIKDSENLENSLQENLSNKTQENLNTNQNLSNSDVSNSLNNILLNSQNNHNHL